MPMTTRDTETRWMLLAEDGRQLWPVLRMGGAIRGN